MVPVVLKENIVFIGTPIDDSVAILVIAQIFFLASEDLQKDISLYINSPGGITTAGLAILDTMNFVQPDIVTHCVGQAASMAAVLLRLAQRGNVSPCRIPELSSISRMRRDWVGRWRISISRRGRPFGPTKS